MTTRMGRHALILTTLTLLISGGCSKQKVVEQLPVQQEGPPPQGEPEPGLSVDQTESAIRFADPKLEACVKSSVVGRDRQTRQRIYADADGNGILSVKEAQAVSSLDCPGMGIENMVGIEVLENLEEINCSANNIGIMPKFSALKKLKTLRCTNNYFTDRDCTELHTVRSQGVWVAEIEKQRDGRKLTCDQVKLVGHRAPQGGIRPLKGESKHVHINDVWGFVKDGKEYAVYSDLTDTHIVRITSVEPYIESVAKFPRGSKGDQVFAHPNHSTWAEQRYFEKDGVSYLYVSSEGGSWWREEDPTPEQLPRLQIFDITDLKNPVLVSPSPTEIHEGLRSIHNIALDSERELLFAFGGTDHHNPVTDEDGNSDTKAWAGARIYSLEDPANPKYLYTVGSLYVHDAQVKSVDVNGSKKHLLYVAHGSSAIHWDANETRNEDNRMAIYDITELSAEGTKVLLDQQYPYGYCHNIWATADGSHIVVTGETSLDNQLSFWELVESDDGSLKAEFRNGLNLQGGALAHNAFIQGNYVYMSHYSKGAQIAEIFTNEAGKRNIRLIWGYDTYPYNNIGRTEGSWGIYPFTKLNPELFFLTDSATGFYVFKKSPQFLAAERN